MGAWVKSLSLLVCILASFLTITSFKLAGTGIPWVVVAAVFFITSATMLHNDWHDRFHDVRKGKMLALQHPGAFLLWLAAFWATAVGLIAIVAVQDTRLGIGLAIMQVVGLLHPEARMIPLVPIALVSLASASPAVLPLAAGANSEKLWPLFLSVALVIFGREITKDIDDKEIDGGYKWTIPLMLGEQRSRIMAAVAIVASLAVAVAKVSLMVLPGACLALLAAVALVRGKDPSTSRQYLDLGMAFVTLTLITFG